MNTESIKKAIKKTPKPKDLWSGALSTGLTTLNLGLSDRPHVGLIRGAYYLFVGESSSGKAQPLSSKIMTTNGWKTMKNIRVGDQVVDPDGGSGTVLQIFPQGKREVYKVKFSDGSKTKCCKDHLWLLESMNDRFRKNGGRVRRLEEFMNRLDRLYLPDMQPFEFEPREKDLFIHPYLMGALLGNGLFGKTRLAISSVESEIQETFSARLPEGYYLSLASGGRGDFNVCSPRIEGERRQNKILDRLRNMGLGECLAEDKFIPKSYLWASMEDRLQLLRGLMDTDGYVSKQGHASYSTASRKLARDICFLIRSLGGWASISRKRSPKYTYKGETKIGQDSFIISVTMPKKTCPFSLQRKIKRYKPRNPRPRRIVSINKTDMEECQCLLVSTKRNLYITDDSIPTHNTFLAHQCLAEAANNPAYKNYQLDYYDIELGALLDTRKFFGKKLADRLNVKTTTSVERFFDETRESMLAGPCVVVLDSSDSLDTEADRKHRKARTTARDTGKDEPGSYGASKAKELKDGLRSLSGKTGPLAKHGSILIIISQTIDNLGFGFEKTTRAGGKALKFFACGEVWFKVKESFKKSVRGKTRKIGSRLQLDVKKNRQTGEEPVILVPFYPSVGFDVIGANIDYLVDEGHWKGGGKKGDAIQASDFKFKGSREGLIRHIEDNDKTEELALLVSEVWDEIKEACRVNRKRRYE